MIQIQNKSICCGCSACANICPLKCIRMIKDEEGFLYPWINETKCNQCGMCERTCPILQVKEEILFEQEAYCIQNKNEKVCLESTSGGAFSAIGKYVIERDGVVFGAAYNQDFEVIHKSETTISGLKKFRNSKYVQSNTGETFTEVKNMLVAGKLVCYSGTPCQIEGLKSFLQKDYENLITVDVVCRAVPSPMIWQKYIEIQREKLGNKISNIVFRDKHYGYKYSGMTFVDNNGKKAYTCGVESDQMLRAFFSNICDRPSCYECVFKKQYRISDFTIWDCFHVGRFSRRLDNDKGATRVLIHTDKGRKIFENIKEDIMYIKMSPEVIVKGSKEMIQSVDRNEKREEFFRNAQFMSGKELFTKYFPDTFDVKMERYVRLICCRLGIYSVAKKVFVKLTNKY